MKTRTSRIEVVLFQLAEQLLVATLSNWESLEQAVCRGLGANGVLPVLEPDRRGRFITRLDKTLKAVMADRGLDRSEMLLCISDPDLTPAATQTGCRIAAFGDFADSPDQAALADFRTVDLTALKRLVRLHTALPTGKLPNDLLREFLDQIIFEDPTVIINPGVGEDIAAVDIQSEEVLVLKSDPITFATDAIGRYLVLVNANDIATSGARPRWLLTTLMFPSGVTPAEIRQVVSDLERFCHQWEITLCGGHTEITDAVNRPVIAGMMAGTVSRSALIEKGCMGTGDSILVTKAAAVEGTAIIAREFEERLSQGGMDPAEIESCKRFLDRISIIPEARIAAATPATTAMHDVTEGGIATALEELGIAGGHRLRILLDRIPVYPETSRVCGLMGIDPLGLIGSGSLLITCRQEDCRDLMRTIHSEGIRVTQIGEVLERGSGIEAVFHDQAAAWPKFEVDEIARLF
jgi:hydrogenase maturation factor